MGMINHRHNHLRLECQALLRVVLLEGGQPLAEKAVAALRQLVRACLLFTLWRSAVQQKSGFVWGCFGRLTLFFTVSVGAVCIEEGWTGFTGSIAGLVVFIKLAAYRFLAERGRK